MKLNFNRIKSNPRVYIFCVIHLLAACMGVLFILNWIKNGIKVRDIGEWLFAASIITGFAIQLFDGLCTLIEKMNARVIKRLLGFISLFSGFYIIVYSLIESSLETMEFYISRTAFYIEGIFPEGYFRDLALALSIVLFFAFLFIISGFSLYGVLKLDNRILKFGLLTTCLFVYFDIAISILTFRREDHFSDYYIHKFTRLKTQPVFGGDILHIQAKPNHKTFFFHILFSTIILAAITAILYFLHRRKKSSSLSRQMSKLL